VNAIKVLDAYKLPVLRHKIVKSLDEAILSAADMQYPVEIALFDDKTNALLSASPSPPFREVLSQEQNGKVFYKCRNGEELRNAFSIVNSKSQGDRTGILLRQRPRFEADPASGAFRVLIRSRIHPRVGPLIEVGSSDGILNDFSVALPPLSLPLARQALQRTKVFQSIQNYGRSKPQRSDRELSDLSIKPTHVESATVIQHAHALGRDAAAQLESTVACFSRLVIEQPIYSSELEIQVDPISAVVTRARIEAVAGDVPQSQISRTAIRPFPTEYCSMWAGDSMGTPPVTFRVVRPEDEALVRRFFHRLTPVEGKDGVPDDSLDGREHDRPVEWFKDRVVRLCHGDYSTKLTLIAEARNRESGLLEILGLAHLNLDGTSSAPPSERQSWTAAESNFGVLVLEHDKSPGLRIELLRRILFMARAEGLQYIQTTIHEKNSILLRTCRLLGFDIAEPENSRVPVRMMTRSSRTDAYSL